MPKIIPALTATQIKNIKPSIKTVTIFDGMETGLHLFIQPHGTKTFRLKAKIDGNDRRITIGSYPEMSLAEAREKASGLKKQIKMGIDPTKPIIQSSVTFSVVANKFVEWKSVVLLRSGTTIRKYNECLKNDLLPTLGHMDIKTIHVSEIVPVLERIEKRSNSLARKNQELISMIIKYSIQRGYRPPYTQPDLSGIVTRAKSKPKLIPDDLRATFARIDQYPEAVMRIAMKLQFLCFLRSSETMGAQWHEIDFKKKEWHVDKGRMKMRRPHVVPLAKQTIELLQELKKISGDSPFLFPSSHDEKSMVRDALSKAFRTCKLGIVPHGCRTAAGSWMRNAGYAPHLVESQLSHVEENEIAGAYQDKPHLMYLSERHQMMKSWANFLTSKNV